MSKNGHMVWHIRSKVDSWHKIKESINWVDVDFVLKLLNYYRVLGAAIILARVSDYLTVSVSIKKVLIA